MYVSNDQIPGYSGVQTFFRRLPISPTFRTMFLNMHSTFSDTVQSNYSTPRLSSRPSNQVEENNICTREDRNKLHLVSSPSLREERLQNIDLEPVPHETRQQREFQEDQATTHTAIPITPRLSRTAYQNRRLRIGMRAGEVIQGSMVTHFLVALTMSNPRFSRVWKLHGCQALPETLSA